MTRHRFSFTLEPLKSVRKHAELEAMKLLAFELEQEAALRAQVGSAERRLSAARRTDDGGVTALELATRQRYVERVEREAEAARARAEAQAGFVEARRGELELAARDREALDRLENRRRAAHKLALRHAERVAADEIAIRTAPSELRGLA